MSLKSLLPFDCEDDNPSAEQREGAAVDSEEEDLYAGLDDGVTCLLDGSVA
jgi:hypothetical protein